MNLGVDEPWKDIVTLDIDDLLGIRQRIIPPDGRKLTIFNGHTPLKDPVECLVGPQLLALDSWLLGRIRVSTP